MEMEIQKTTRKDIYEVDFRNIVVINDFNSRKDFGDIEELAKQIEKDGVLNPLHVKPFKDENKNEKYYLVDGERRYRAIKYLIDNHIKEVMKVPVLYVKRDLSDEDMVRIQLQCNEGKGFTEYEYGIAYQKLKDLGKTNEEIAALVGKKIWHINVCLAHLNRNEEVQQLMKDGVVTGSDVRRVYQANKGDEQAAVNTLKHLNEIATLRAEEEKEKNPKKADKVKKRISLTDLNCDNKTIVAQDTMKIRMGLVVLMKYLKNVTDVTCIDVLALLDALKKDNSKALITDVLNNDLVEKQQRVMEQEL